MFLSYLHPDANSLFAVYSDLKKVCTECIDPNVRTQDNMVQLFFLVKPMLAAQVPPNEVIQKMGGDEFVIETKFDGNRYQVHRSGDKLVLFSRKNRTPTGLESIEPFLKQCIAGDDWIIDGELMAWDEDEKKFGPFKEVRAVMAGNSEHKLYFIVFDILMLNKISLLNEPLKHRSDLLKQVFVPFEGKVELVSRQIASTLAEVERAVDNAIERRYEGIMVRVFEVLISFYFVFPVFARSSLWMRSTCLEFAAGSKSSLIICMVLETPSIWLFWEDFMVKV